MSAFEGLRRARLISATGVAIHGGYPIFRRTVWWVSKLFATVQVYGVENIPAPEGEIRGLDYYPLWYERNYGMQIDTHAYVIVPNHQSVLDISTLGAFHRPKAIVGKPSFAMVPIFSQLFQRMGLVPVLRGKDKGGNKLMAAWRKSVSYTPSEMYDVAAKALERGIPVEIYPTGSRKYPETKRGAFIVACRAGVPIVPVAIAGCKKGDKTTRTRVLRRRRIVMVVGKPITHPYKGEGLIPDDVLDELVQRWEHQVYDVLLPEAEILRSKWHVE